MDIAIIIVFSVLLLGMLTYMVYLVSKHEQQIEAAFDRMERISTEALKLMHARNPVEKVEADIKLAEFDRQLEEIDRQNKVLEEMQQAAASKPNIVHSADGRELDLNGPWEIV